MSNLQTALNRSHIGYYVHPLAPGDKMSFAGGNGYHDATRDEAQIRDCGQPPPTPTSALV